MDVDYAVLPHVIDLYYFHRFIFNILTSFILLIIMLELVAGIIIDAFSEIREETNQKQ